jgi:hypothetical protein
LWVTRAVAPCFDGFFSAGLFSFTGFAVDEEDLAFFAFVDEDFDFLVVVVFFVVVVVDDDAAVVVGDDDDAWFSWAASEGAATEIATANARKVIRRRMGSYLASNHDAGEPQSSALVCSSIKPSACGSCVKTLGLLATRLVSSFSRTGLLF